MTSDLGPVANTGMGEAGGCRSQAVWAQATDERVSCFHSSCSLVRSWELQNWYFSISQLLTWPCRQAVTLAERAHVCRTGGGILASSPSSATDLLWGFSEPLRLSGASVFSSVEQDSWIPAGAGPGGC